MITEPSLTYTTILDSIKQFLAILIHNVIYYYNVYPPESFTRVRQYNTAVYLCRSPAVKDYIDSAAEECLRVVKSGNSAHVSILILGKRNTPVARFPVRLNLPVVSPSDEEVPITDSLEILEDLSLEYYSFFTRLSTLGPTFENSKAEHSFRIELQLDEPQTMENWIKSEVGESGHLPALDDMPIRKIEAGPVEIVCWKEDMKKGETIEETVVYS